MFGSAPSARRWSNASFDSPSTKRTQTDCAVLRACGFRGALDARAHGASGEGRGEGCGEGRDRGAVRTGEGYRSGPGWLPRHHARMPPFRGADLHCHSMFSDGVDARLARRPRRRGGPVGARPVGPRRGHGLADFEAAAKGTGRDRAGEELSTRCNGEDVHVLASSSTPGAGAEGPAGAPRDRDLRGEAMVEKLAALGLPLELAAIRRVVGGGPRPAPRRPRDGRQRPREDVEEAFEVAGAGKPGYVPKPKWTLAAAIAAVRTAGGLAVVAHPVWYTAPEQVVALGVAAGLDGLEVDHVDQAGKETVFARLAERYRLLRSAGSDFHAPGEGRQGAGRAGSTRPDGSGSSRPPLRGAPSRAVRPSASRRADAPFPGEARARYSPRSRCPPSLR